jgi:hypothetical protein
MVGKDENMNWEDLLNFNAYKRPVFSTRKGVIFQVHPYPTKIDYRSIIPFILAHTQIGELVYDCFAGTCSTGLAAASCIEKDEGALEGLEKESIEKAKWGARKAICFDIGALPTFIGRTLTKPMPVQKLPEVFDEWISKIEREWGWLYKTKDPEGREGTIRYIYSSNMIRCQKCNEQIPYIEIFVDFEKGDFKDTATCPKCNFTMDGKHLELVMEKVKDRLLETDIVRVRRVPYFVYGTTENRNWERKATDQDIEAIQKIEEMPLPDSVKPVPMMETVGSKKWGEMYRAGYHRDISHVHHFYSPRNFMAVAILYHEARKIPDEYRDAITLVISSYNVAHSTLMTRFVFKKGNKNPVNTSAQPAALYIPNCQVEKNVFIGIRRKFKGIVEALRKVSEWNPNIEVKRIPAQDNGLKSNSVDYIFTDPPFGENIQYSEVNFLSEAWLQSFTNNQFETIISDYQNKGVGDYESLLTKAFEENYRVLKPAKFMTVVFHNTNKEVWNGLRRAILRSGFIIVETSILDKTQTSFKQTTTNGAVKKDLIILTWKPESDNHYPKNHESLGPREFIIRTLEQAKAKESPERTFDYLFGRFVGYRLSSGEKMLVSAKEFRKILTNIAEERSGYWYLKQNN